MPSLLQAAKSVTALRKVAELDPENRQAWNLGGTLLVDHLGMMDDALEWWEKRRVCSDRSHTTDRTDLDLG